MNSILTKGEQIFVLKDSISKKLDFADDPFLIESFQDLHPLPIHNKIQQTTNDID